MSRCELKLGFSDSWGFLHERGEDGSELVIDAGIGTVGTDRMDVEGFVKEGGEDDGGTDHLAATLVEVAVNFNEFALHDVINDLFFY